MRPLPHSLRLCAGLLPLLFLPFLSCLSPVIFLIATIAGTSSNLQPFQLRSTSLTFLGTLLGLVSFLVIRLITSSKLSVFFLSIPPISFFAALRPDKRQVPLVPVATIILGFLLISHKDPESDIPAVALRTLFDATAACLLAFLVNLPFPHRASDHAAHTISQHLLHAAEQLSSLAGGTLNAPPEPPPFHLPEPTSHVIFDITPGVTSFPGVVLPNPPDSAVVFDVPNARMRPVHRTKSMTSASAKALADLSTFLGATGCTLSAYSALATVGEHVKMALYEPVSETYSVRRWLHLKNTVVQLRNKLALLTSAVRAAEMQGEEGRRFQYQTLETRLGKHMLPFWRDHYAALSAVCVRLSHIIASGKPCDSLSSLINAVEWRRRRAHMMYSFFLRFPQCSIIHAHAARHESPQSAHAVLNALLEMQAIACFVVSSHALAEITLHIHAAVADIQTRSEAASSASLLTKLRACVASLLRILLSAATPFLRRVRTLHKMQGWELQFVMSHSFLCLSILALALFLPLPSQFTPPEVAWVFTSAVLAAQLSVEPTLFIGFIRVVATASGSLLALGYTAFLGKIGRDTYHALQYLIAPYFVVLVVLVMNLLSAKWRYASFLLLSTNCLVIICPRGSDSCLKALRPGEVSAVGTSCYPNWQYALSRSANVSIGVVLALLFHVLLWPRFANKEALRILSKAIVNASRTMGKIRRTYFAYGVEFKAWNERDDDDNDDDGGVKGDSESSSPDEEVQLMQPTDENDIGTDIYRYQENVMNEVREKLSVLVSQAVLIVKAEAGVWRSGPMRLCPLFPNLLHDFIALDVNISELGALLGRRAIFSPTYGRSVFNHYIRPTLKLYETIYISLQNVSGIMHRMLTESEWTDDEMFDLYKAILHLTRMRTELRNAAADKWAAFEQQTVPAIAVKERLDEWSELGILPSKASMFDLNLLEEQEERNQSSESEEGSSGKRVGMCVDDVVLYNTFSFLADGCISVFVRIAVTLLRHTRERTDERNKRRKEREQRNSRDGSSSERED